MAKCGQLIGHRASQAARASLGAYPVQFERARAFIEHLDGAGASAAPATFLGPWVVEASGVDVGGFIGPPGEPDGGLTDRRGRPVEPSVLGLDARGPLPPSGRRTADRKAFAVPVADDWRLIVGTRGGVVDDGLEALCLVIASLTAPCLEAARGLSMRARRRAAREERRLHAVRHRLPPGTVAESPLYRRALARIARLAEHGDSALLIGETGVGKEILARAYHALGPRSAGPFVAVNCGALPEALAESLLFGHVRGAFTGASGAREGLLAASRGGVVFLDEIGELPRPLQAKLLRALDGWVRPVGDAGAERPIDLAVVAATHRDPDDPDLLRPDLRQRLGSRIAVAPLRERPSDAVALARRWVRALGAQRGFDACRLAPDAVELVRGWRLGGNARELRRRVMEAFAFELEATDEWVRAEHLSCLDGHDPGRPASLADQIAAFEARRVAALLRASPHVAAAARRAGDHDQTFRKRIARLERDGFLEPDGDGWRPTDGR